MPRRICGRRIYLEARLAGADLSFANLTNARLDDADLAGAELAGALIAGARLNLARNLTQAQVEAAYGDDATLLPPGLTMPAAWREPLALATGIGPMNMLPPDWLAFDPYAVLEIDRKAKMADARAAYLKLAKRFHPDLNPGDEIAEQRFKNINHAYRVLAARDEMRRRNRRGRSTPPWAAAAGLFFLAFTIPGALVYWLDVPALIGRAERLDRTTRPERQTVTALLGIADAADRAMFTASAGPPSGPLPRSAKGPRLKAHENAAERVNTAATVSGAPSIIAAAAKTYDRTATPGEAEKALTGAAVYAEPLNEDAREGATVTPVPVPALSKKQQLAALEDPAAAPDDFSDAPWNEEWADLRDSTDLRALQSFISRYPEKPQAEDARKRFRQLVAAVDKVEELQSLIREVPKGTPETALAKERLARLIEDANVEADNRAWQEAREADTIAGYRAYLAGFPDGRYADDAQDRLAALENAMSAHKEDDAAWARARLKGTIAAVEAYLGAHPRGRYTAEAREMLAVIKAKSAATRKEDEAWAKARAENTAQAYRDYLNVFPRGRYAGRARHAAGNGGGGPSANAAEALNAPVGASPGEDASNRGMRWPSSDEPFVEQLPRSY